ncbi:hypothetical protein CJ030_MR2G012913 [Morella rubra]|uniref:Glycosyltransferase 61 catalytic domain-containing protein n=1 Tax=Morella rubra TaxID=262757 RepID=A0A6A1WJD1_9ROSI|nr:hypothetical protein CJ030_MR2G012913 [Morella rubra]
MAAGFKSMMVRDTSSSPSMPSGPVTGLSEMNISSSSSPSLGLMTHFSEENTSSSPYIPSGPATDFSEKTTTSSSSPPLGPMTDLSEKNTSSSSSSASPPQGPMTHFSENNMSSSPSMPSEPAADLSEKNTSSSSSPPPGPMTGLSEKNTSNSSTPSLRPMTHFSEKNTSSSPSMPSGPATDFSEMNTTSSSSLPLGPMTLFSEKNTRSSPSIPSRPATDLLEMNTSNSSSPPPGRMTDLSEKNTSSSQDTVKAAEMVIEKTEPVPEKKEPVTKKMEPLCNVMEQGADICDLQGNVRIQGNSSTVFFVSPPMNILAGTNNSWSIKPYARKFDGQAMKRVREWSVKSISGHEELPRCSKNHSVPAILFSGGGYTGNQFHDFSDVLIPLYLTSRKYNGEVQFLITNKKTWWIEKYGAILRKLTRYELIDIDKEEEVHCFSHVTVGLKRELQELTINASKYSYSMRDFTELLRSSYSLKRANAIKLRDGQRKMPKLLIIARSRTRRFTNVEEISKMARSLGYKVLVAEATGNISKFAKIVNSCDVLVGVHGAGLTNIIFLPENAIFIQVLPFGGFEWVAANYYGNPGKVMNLKYMEYKISKEESTLIQQYPSDHEILTNPREIFRKQGFVGFKSVFMDKQDINVDVNSFRPTLLKALELLHR